MDMLISIATIYMCMVRFLLVIWFLTKTYVHQYIQTIECTVTESTSSSALAYININYAWFNVILTKYTLTELEFEVVHEVSFSVAIFCNTVINQKMI